MPTEPIAYFLTWTTHGSWLHGDERGSVDHGPSGTTPVRRDDLLAGFERREMGAMHEPEIEPAMRTAIEGAVAEVCEVRGWTLIAINVRTTHIHAVVAAAGVAPERALNDFKAWATRRVRALGLVEPGLKMWTRHGSTRYLWSMEDVAAARAYVLHHQGMDLPGSTAEPPNMES